MRFHFHTEDGQTFPDEEGTELPDLASACVEATKVLGELLREWPHDLCDQHKVGMRVADDAGATLFTVDVAVTMAPGVRR